VLGSDSANMFLYAAAAASSRSSNSTCDRRPKIRGAVPRARSCAHPDDRSVAVSAGSFRRRLVRTKAVNGDGNATRMPARIASPWFGVSACTGVCLRERVCVGSRSHARCMMRKCASVCARASVVWCCLGDGLRTFGSFAPPPRCSLLAAGSAG
jgi:hypothetical protein